MMEIYRQWKSNKHLGCTANVGHELQKMSDGFAGRVAG